MKWSRIILLAFAVAVFAVLHAPIAPPVKDIVGAIIGVVFVAAFFGLRYRRPPCE